MLISLFSFAIAGVATFTTGLLAQTSPDFSVGLELFKQSPLVAGMMIVVIFFIRHLDKVYERNTVTLEASKKESEAAMTKLVEKNQMVIQPLIDAIKTNTEITRSNIPVLSRVEKVLDLTLQQQMSKVEKSTNI